MNLRVFSIDVQHVQKRLRGAEAACSLQISKCSIPVSRLSAIMAANGLCA
jgi:hypothetical protein